MNPLFHDTKVTISREGKISEMKTGKLRLEGSQLYLKTFLLKHKILDIGAVTKLERNTCKLTVHLTDTYYSIVVHQPLDQAKPILYSLVETIGKPLSVDEDTNAWENNAALKAIVDFGKKLFGGGPGLALFKSKPFLIGFGLLVVLAAIFGEPRKKTAGEDPNNQNTENAQEETPATVKDPGLQYTVFLEELDDTPVKTQVSLKVVLTSPKEAITKQSVNKLLDRLYTEIMRRTGYKFHGGSPASAYIYVYTDAARAQSGAEWIGMLGKCHDCKAPNVGFSDSQFTHLLQPPEEKFGLSEEKRKEVWTALIQAEDKAGREAEAAHPVDPTQALKKGDRFKTTQRTPLIPRFGVDPLQAISELVQLPPGTRLKVTSVDIKEGGKFYKVTASPPRGRKAKGWIKPVALMGQGDVDPMKQIRKQTDEMERLNAKYDTEVSKKYNLTKEELDKISLEGLTKSWPIPTMQ